MSLSELLTQYGTSLESVLIALFVGLFFALGVLFYNKYIPGRIVRYLIGHQIHDESSAVTLAEAGFAKSRLIAFTLREGSMLRKLVVCLPDEEDGRDRKGRVELSRARIYLPEDKCYRADMAYNNNGASLLTVLLTVLLFLVMLALLAIMVPWLLGLIEDFLDLFKGDGTQGK